MWLAPIGAPRRSNFRGFWMEFPGGVLHPSFPIHSSRFLSDSRLTNMFSLVHQLVATLGWCNVLVRKAVPYLFSPRLRNTWGKRRPAVMEASFLALGPAEGWSGVWAALSRWPQTSRPVHKHTAELLRPRFTRLFTSAPAKSLCFSFCI